MMKASEIRDLSEDEILERERELTEELFNLRFRLATGQLENTARVRQVKRDLARMKTIIREGQDQKAKGEERT